MKKFGAILSAFILSVSSSFVLFVGQVSAAAVVWDGSAGDHKLTTDANWVGGTAPIEGDDLIFPYGTGVTDKAPENDFTAGTTFASIVFSGTSSGEDNYTLAGNSLELTAGVAVTTTGDPVHPTVDLSITVTGSQSINAGGNSLNLDGVISGSGNLTKAGLGAVYLNGANTFTGSLDINAGTLRASTDTGLGTTAGSTTVNDGADLYFITSDCNDTSISIAEDITLDGDSSSTSGDIPTPKLSAAKAICIGGGLPDELYGLPGASTGTVTLSGDITLTSDVTFGSLIKTNTLTGALSGSHKFSMVAGYPGKLTVNASPNTSSMANGTYTPEAFKKTLSNSLPSSSVAIDDTAIITLTGTRGDISIAGGTLKGTGTAGSISMTAGTIAPGMSPGTLNSGNVSFTGGTHQVELGGTASGQYDQLNVTGTVALGTATELSASLYGGFKPAVGDKFTIINNDGSDVITGTFDNLAEGATFKVSGYVLKVSYVGGTGNDAVLTVLSLPAAPDTGFGLITSNPLIAVTLLCVVAPALAYAARRSYSVGRR